MLAQFKSAMTARLYGLKYIEIKEQIRTQITGADYGAG